MANSYEVSRSIRFENLCTTYSLGREEILAYDVHFQCLAPNANFKVTTKIRTCGIAPDAESQRTKLVCTGKQAGPELNPAPGATDYLFMFGHLDYRETVFDADTRLEPGKHYYIEATIMDAESGTIVTTACSKIFLVEAL